MPKLLAPSLMCIDLLNAARDITALEKAGVDYLHVDIMDNHFVPNITLGTDFVRGVKAFATLPLDVHLMIENPEQSLESFACLDGNDFLVVHVEATRHVQRTLAAIRAMGVRPGIALNPATPESMLTYLLDDIDLVLVMTVNPGFAGQSLVPAALEKITRVKKLLAENGRGNVIVEVDGNVSFENAVKMNAAGADMFVGGSSSIFKPGASIEENCARLRGLLE